MFPASMREHILVVDDSPTIRRVVCSILEDAEFECSQAADGEQALAKLRNGTRADLELVDFVMPDMNGFKYCRELREDESLAELPVVLMSAMGEKMRGQFADNTGAVDAITKPFDPLALVAVIEGAFAKYKRARESSHDELAPDETTGTGDDETLSLGDLVLSDDPGLRRSQITHAYCHALSKMIAPAIAELSGAPSSDTGEEARKIIEASLTTQKLGALAGLVGMLEHGSEANPAALSGELAFISLAEALQMLNLQRQSGVLEILTPEVMVSLYLQQGRIDLALGRGLPVSYRLGRYLVQEGALSREDLDQYLTNKGKSKRLIGDALVLQGYITPDQVQTALRLQTSEFLYEAVRFKTGKFRFMGGGSCPEAAMAELALDPTSLIMEGFRRGDEWHMIEDSFDFDDVLARDPAAAEPTAITGAELTVLELIDGERTVRKIIDLLDMNTFDACKALYQFINSRLVRKP